ncbi:hypothetical protein QFC19_001162 [Naganishia cerealis]|uniref:Uncharacterized protein n=1 Tax=Naganishia cerealis TaxID=610337 RepID=A0ACC2WJ19_9TREE|nr:hypothetical protein QFC19_001162 [Naganishia cerealis]
MPTSQLFAFGSNPFGKTCPGIAEIIVREPVDILPALLCGTREGIDAIDVLQSSWDRTLIGLRQSEYVSLFRHSSHAVSYHLCTPEESQEILYWGLGYNDRDNEILSAVRLSADAIDNFARIESVRALLQEAGFHRTSNLAVLESGSIYADISDDEPQNVVTPGCVWIETLFDLESDAHACWKSLPGPPGTTYTVATGLSHAVLLSRNKVGGFGQVLGIGDNRYGAALPKSAECKYPPSHLSEPIPIEPLCGIAIAGIGAGGSRSAAWSHEGEAWMWGQGIDGLDPVQIPLAQKRTGSEGEGTDIAIASIAVGDGYDFVLTKSGLLWVRGDSKSVPVNASTDID